MSTYAVTGVAGFIGSSVAEQLLSEGHSVIGIDNLNDAYDVRLKCWRLERMQHCSRMRFHRADVSDRKQVEAVFEENGPVDAVLNLAARAGVRASVENPHAYVETNVTGITGTSMSFSGQTPGLQHYYFLYAHDAAGNSSAAAILGTFNPLPTPAALSNLAPAGSGGFQFTVQSGWAQTTLIQATSNLEDPTSWVTIATNPPSSSTYIFTDTNAYLFPMRFYRVLSP